jgi:hypothetical protein
VKNRLRTLSCSAINAGRGQTPIIQTFPRISLPDIHARKPTFITSAGNLILGSIYSRFGGTAHELFIGFNVSGRIIPKSCIFYQI